ncbi:MAG: ribosome maturation factor RimM [Nitratireductor sp.]|nr:ribosome maturation factor RimM [Nitratireductor sp.]
MAGTSILVGKFGAAVGLKGEVRLQSFTAEPEAIAGYRTLALDDGSRVRIASLRPQGNVLVARIEGVNDRNAAERLTGRELFIDRAELPETEDEDEFYLADLVGLEVRDVSGAKTGVVAAVHNFGAGDILEIRPVSGPVFMAPFTKAAVPDVKIAEGHLVFVPPAETSEREGE